MTQKTLFETIYPKVVRDIITIAHKYDWRLCDFQEENRMVSFCKGINSNRFYKRINVYYTKMTVGTAINHPKKGRTQLFRKNVSMEELEKLFANPRTHTNKGYYGYWDDELKRGVGKKNSYIIGHKKGITKKAYENKAVD